MKPLTTACCMDNAAYFLEKAARAPDEAPRSRYFFYCAAYWTRQAGLLIELEDA